VHAGLQAALATALPALRAPLQVRRAKRERRRLMASLEEERMGLLGFIVELPRRGSREPCLQGGVELSDWAGTAGAAAAGHWGSQVPW
jgi:hypothetical protein